MIAMKIFLRVIKVELNFYTFFYRAKTTISVKEKSITRSIRGFVFRISRIIFFFLLYVVGAIFDESKTLWAPTN